MLSGGVLPDSADFTSKGFSASSGVVHHKVPDYVEILDVSNDDFKDSRILVLPDGRFNNYRWGAGGAADFLLIMSKVL